jgi:hypothetical protein
MYYQPKVLSMEYGLLGQSRHKSTTKTKDETTKVTTVRGAKEITLEPWRKDEGAICEVTMRYKLIMPEEYSDITSFAQATIGAELRVENVPEGFEFVSSGETTSTSHENGDRAWHFDRPFVTNQHIRIWWFKKSSSVDQGVNGR